MLRRMNRLGRATQTKPEKIRETIPARHTAAKTK
jgi:hypothetical protein